MLNSKLVLNNISNTSRALLWDAMVVPTESGAFAEEVSIWLPGPHCKLQIQYDQYGGEGLVNDNSFRHFLGPLWQQAKQLQVEGCLLDRCIRIPESWIVCNYCVKAADE